MATNMTVPLELPSLGKMLENMLILEKVAKHMRRVKRGEGLGLGKARELCSDADPSSNSFWHLLCVLRPRARGFLWNLTKV